MGKTHVLHELIHSLSKSEKRFIKLNAQFHQGDKAYMKLFDAIEKQKKYDEEVLKVKFRNESFIKQFGVVKNYLQQFILKQLRNYNSDSKASIICQNLLIDIELLYWKGQFVLMKRLIIKAEKIAKKYQLYLVLEELLNWESRLNTAQVKMTLENVEEANKKHEAYMERYNYIVEYKKLINQTHFFIKQAEIIRTDEDKKTIEKLLNNKLLKEIPKGASFDEHYNFYLLNGVLNRLVNNEKASGEFREKLLAYMEKHPHMLEENTIRYLSAIHNLLMHSLIIKDYNLYEKSLSKLKKLEAKTIREKAAIIESLCLFELGYYNETKQYDKAVNFVNNFFLKQPEILINQNKEHYYLVHYHATLAYFNLKDYKNALIWVNKVINLTSKMIRVDIRAATNIINILIHFELKNLLLIPYLVKSTIEFLKLHHLQTDFDKKFLFILLSLTKTNDIKNHQKIIAKNISSLERLDKTTSIVSDIDVLEWLKYKMV
ncbi:MAG: hypothetical protein RQ875_13125 [Vicingaceae bacterium]|nr:hypothetical protein [Vicingaceae bacterium]